MTQVHEQWTAYGRSSWASNPPAHAQPRAFVLGGGGATGIGWLRAIIGLREQGIDLGTADTSSAPRPARSSHPRRPADTARPRLRPPPRSGAPQARPARSGDARRFLRARPGRSHGRAVIRRRPSKARTATEEEFIDVVAVDLRDTPWPSKRLIITTVDAVTGELTLFTNDSEVPLDRAVAASCRPGSLPAVTIRGRQYVDGGVRSAANADLAIGHERVLTLAPIRWPSAATTGRRSRPSAWVRARDPWSSPPTAGPALIGFNPLDMSKASASVMAGRDQADRIAERVAALWQ